MSFRDDLSHGAWVYRLQRRCGMGRLASLWRAIREWRAPF